MKALKKLARRGRLERKGQFVSIYGLAAGGARAAMHECGAPGARGRAGGEKKNRRLSVTSYDQTRTQTLAVVSRLKVTKTMSISVVTRGELHEAINRIEGCT
jgi:hypothetical protein